MENGPLSSVLSGPSLPFYTVGSKDHNILPHIDLRNRIVIRWGSYFSMAKIPGTITYNTRVSTRRADNKRLSRNFLLDNGVSAPRVVAPDSTNISYPIIARPWHHSWGYNFIVLHNAEDFLQHYNIHEPRGWYYSEYIDKVQEFRVHIGHGKILSVLERFKGRDPYSWNSAQSRTPLSLLTPDQWNLSVIQESLKAHKTLKMDFAGIDAIVDKAGQVYILEINTRPSVMNTLHTQKQYARYFDWLAVSSRRKSHFDIESNNPADYGWKDNDWSESNLRTSVNKQLI